MKLLKFIMIAFILTATVSSYAQKKEEKGKPEKQEKIRTSWSVGVSGAATMLKSDVNFQFKGYAVNLNINKALSNSFALRLHGGFGNVYGIDNKPSKGASVTSNTALNGTNNPLVNYALPLPVKDVYSNFKTTFKNAYIEGLYYLPISDFRKAEKQKARIYLFGGIGGIVYNTKVDQLGDTGMYNYSGIILMSQKERAESIRKNILDGKYETNAEVDPNHNTQLMGGTLLFSLDAGLGFTYSIGERLEINLEAAYSYTGTDLMDGVRWQESGSLTGNNDALILFGLGVNYRFGKTTNIYWFDNPEAMHYKATLQNKRKVDQLSTDTDGDGVADYFDRDPETPSGVAVDGSGKPVDTDKDGIADYIDSEPFSDKNAVVDSVGTSLDSDVDGVPDHRDLEPKTPAGTLVNFQGKSIRLPEVQKVEQTGTVTPLGFIPAVFFDFGSSVIRPEYYNAILELVDALKHYPNDKLKIIGHTDAIGNTGYNIELGKRRAQLVADILVASGIDKSRLIIESKGAVQPLTVVSKRDMDKLNRRVQFEVVTGGVIRDNPIDKKEKYRDKEKDNVKVPKTAVEKPAKQTTKKPAEKPVEKPKKTNDPEIDNLFKPE